ncbi:MAG: D-2-hydroxyacid dehydrogenase family protein [Hyphomicrobiaceae bacterium]|nr:D-2-hydroxyacid dehydrogenase family protein [Hyphomicrobiaceae bacterium]
MVAIAILDDYQKAALELADWSRLRENHRLTIFHEPFVGEEAAARALVGFDVLCLMRERTPFQASLIDRLPNLRLIVTSGRRNAAIDVAAAARQKVLVCGTDSPGNSTAELTMALMLALARHVHVEAAAMRAGGWQTTLGRDLRGLTLGLVGLGRLGGQVAKFGRTFGMKVIAWSENLTQQRCYEAGAEYVAKDDLLRRADVVSIHTRLSERTRGLIGARELALMKPSAHLVNTSRGPIVDEAALIAALNEGRIAGAALDVYDREPLPADHPLRSAPRVLLTPHLGYVTEETYRVFYSGMVGAIEAWLAGKPVGVIEP